MSSTRVSSTGTGSGRATGLGWLTAFTTASLTLTACHANAGLSPARADRPAASSQHRTTPAPPLAPRRHAMTAPAVPATLPATQAASDQVVQAGPRPAEPAVLVISDGTEVVHVGDREVRFPTAVTDATLSPNGAVIGFVDGAGNIATARLDGTGLRPLTSSDAGVLRAQPTFEDGGSEIVFTERGRDGVWRLKEVAADGHDGLTGGQPDSTVAETAADHGHDTAPSAAWYQASHTQESRSVLLFEHRLPSGRMKVYVADRNQRGFGSYPLFPGRAPAVSPTGDRVAYITAAGQIEVRSVGGAPGHVTQVTWGAHPTGHLAWSPDGRRIAFSTTHDVESVSSTPLHPGHSPARVLSPHPGVASLGSTALPVVATYPATDPVRAAVAVSRARFVDGTDLPMDEESTESVFSADHVTLLSSSDPAAAPVAAAIASGGPVLFVRHGRLAPQVRDEILRLLQRPREDGRPAVDIVGSSRAVPDRVAADLRAAGLRVLRFDPGDPDAAAAAVADTTPGDSTSYVVVSRDDLPAIASAAAADQPILLTDGSSMPAATALELNHLESYGGEPATVYAVGRAAQAAVRSAWSGKNAFRVVDLGGADAPGDSLAAVQGLYDAPGHLAVASSADWADQLIGGMIGPVLVVDRSRSSSDPAPSDAAWLSASQPVMRSVYVVGGSHALTHAVGDAVYGGRYAPRTAPRDITG